MRFTVEAAAGKLSVSAEWTNPLRYSKVETPKPAEYQLPLFEVEVGENGVIPQPKGSNRFFESLKKPFKSLFGRRKEAEQVVTNPHQEVRDILIEDFRQTDQVIERVLMPGLAIFGAAAAIFTATASFLRPPVVEISSPPKPAEDPKPPADSAGSLPARQHVPFIDVARIIGEVDLIQQRLHPEMAQAPKVEIPSMDSQPEEPEILPDEEVLTDQKLSDEQIITRVATGHGQFTQILALLKENGEENPSSERMIEVFRLNFLDKVDAFKASANGIINNPYEYPGSSMQRKAREQLAAIDFLLDRYQKDQKMAFEIEFEYNRRAQNYSAPPPEQLQVLYAQAA